MLENELFLNFALLLACYAYVLCMIFFSGRLSRVPGFSLKISRKFLHMMIGNLPFLIPFFSLNSFPLNFPFLVAAPFILLTFLVSPYSHIPGLNAKLKGLSGITDEGHHFALVYYAISYTILALFFSSTPYIIAAGILPMAYGDSLAALIGERYGKTNYHVFANKSVEGSLVMLLVSFFSLECSLLFFAALYPLDFLNVTIAALCVAFVATFAEALSPRGLDNLTVPILGATAFLFLVGGL